MTLIKQEFQKHIKKINNNDFIYKHKIAFFLLSEQQLKLYEEGFKKGFELAQQKMSDHVSEIKETHIVPRQMERKIIGYQFRKPRQREIDCVINKVFTQDHTTVLNSIQMKQHRRRFWNDEQTIWQEFEELTRS